MYLFKALYFAFKMQQQHCELSFSLTQNTSCLSTLLSTHSQHKMVFCSTNKNRSYCGRPEATLSPKSGLLQESTALIQRWSWHLMCNSPDKFFWYEFAQFLLQNCMNFKVFIIPSSTTLFIVLYVWHRPFPIWFCTSNAWVKLESLVSRAMRSRSPSESGGVINSGMPQFSYSQMGNSNTSLKSILRYIYMDGKFCRKPNDFPSLHP